MQILDIAQKLSANPYPGRGIILGKSDDGKNAVIVYFIMGRSENSRNRVFVECDGGIRTQAFDESKLSDPSLIIYAPVRVLGDATIVTNGDQTDTVYDYMAKGAGFEDALRTRTFEPDAPNFTPRISGVATLAGGDFSYKLSILKSGNVSGDCVERFFFDYPQPVAGEGRFLHTYRCDGDPIPSFEGEPVRVAISGTIDELTKLLWTSLDNDNKVSLFVRYIPLDGSAVQTRIINKNN